MGGRNAQQPRLVLHRCRPRRRRRCACSANCCGGFRGIAIRERAAWKSGWFAYRSGQLPRRGRSVRQRGAARSRGRTIGRRGSTGQPARSDQLGDADTANARYRLIVADYQNSYYGRLATKLLRRSQAAGGGAVDNGRGCARSPTFPTDELIRALTAAGLYDDALKEVAVRAEGMGRLATAAGDVRVDPASPGTHAEGHRAVQALRGAITAMRRAYPQFLAAGGEQLPPEVLRIIFPLDYWPLITKYSDGERPRPVS